MPEKKKGKKNAVNLTGKAFVSPTLGVYWSEGFFKTPEIWSRAGAMWHFVGSQ